MPKRQIHPKPGESLSDVREKDPGYTHEKYDPSRSGKICMQCEKQKGTDSFQLISRNPPVYAPICKSCVIEVDQAQFREDIRSHRMKKEFRRQHKTAITEIKKKQRRRHRQDKQARIQKTAANAEFASRTLSQKRLLPYIKRFNKTYLDGWVHRMLCRELEKFSDAVVRKESPRLMVFMPPRIGKSEIGSKRFPSWHLGRNPSHEVIAASYAVSLPMGFSRINKEVMKDPAFQVVFPDCKLNKDAQATEGWVTTEGGGYVPAGVNGGITGKGAHVLVIDDPVKDSQEADSETQRQAVWDWYSSTAYTRLSPGAGILVIQTRWHDDDLSGRIIRKSKENHMQLEKLISTLEEELSLVSRSQRTRRLQLTEELDNARQEYEELEKWKILVFPQEATQDEYYDPFNNQIVYSPDDVPTRVTKVRSKGEPLHPERYTRRMVNLQKRTLEPRHWSALHQQNPVPEEGEYYTKAMFRYEPTVWDWRWSDVYLAGDLAIGEKQSNDWNVFMVGALDYAKNLHLIDMVRFRGKTNLIVDNLVAVLAKYQSRMAKWGLERGQIQMAVWDPLVDRMKEEGLALPFDDSLTPVTDKLARGRTAQGMLQQGRIILPADQPWTTDATSELIRFPGGLFDDVCDALAWLAKMTVKAVPPRRPKRETKKSWKDDLERFMRQTTGSEGAMGA